MSVEIWFYPESASKKDLHKHLIENGFTKTKSPWPSAPGTSHYFWFDDSDYRSAVGVEATIYLSNKEEERDSWLGNDDSRWILHTRTRAGASRFDRSHQNEIIRYARRRFKGSFYNDWHGRNRYTPLEEEHHTPAERGVIATYNRLHFNLFLLSSGLPKSRFEHGEPRPNPVIADMLRELDPSTYLYNALLPYAVATLEHFFSRVFVILLRYSETGQNRIEKEKRKVDLIDILAVGRGEKTVEELIASWYSFQNIDSIQKAFGDWLDIDVWRIIRKQRRIGRKTVRLADRLEELIQSRHGLIHRFEFNMALDRDSILEIIQTVNEIMRVVLESLEKDYGMNLTDGLS